MNRMFRIASIVLFAMLVLSASAYAQSTPVYFPYVINDSQTVSELVFTNATGRDASVTLTSYKEDGSSPSVTKTSVPANAQVVFTPDATFKGWVLATSDAPGVLGNLRVSSPNRAAQELSEPAQVGSTLVFPFVTQAGGASTELAVVNPSTNAVRVELSVSDKEGRAITTTMAALPAFGMVRGSIAAIFGTDKNYANASHVVAHFIPGSILSPVSEASGLGFEIVHGFVQADAASERIPARSDWAALPGVPTSATGTAFTFPHVVRGGNWFSLIGIVNTSDAARNVTFTYSTATNPNAGMRTLSLPANGAARLTVTDLFGPGQESGFLKLVATGNIAAFATTGTSSGVGFTAALGQTTGQTEFFFPNVDETSSSFTGLALLNDGSAQASVNLFLINAKGETLGSASETIRPGQRVVKDLTDDIGPAFNTKGGFVFVRSSAPLIGTAISGIAERTLNQTNGRATVPGFAPPPTTSAGPANAGSGIAGRVSDFGTGAPASGVTMTLSRVEAEDVVTTTDANGFYSFNVFTNGGYTIKPTQTGRVFSPPSAFILFNGTGLVVDFIRETLPVINSLTVVTADTGSGKTAGNNPEAFAIFGTSEVLLKIDGFNFASGQRVFFGTRALTTDNVNILDEKTIFARLVLNSDDLLAELVKNGSYGRYDITIAGQSPFEATRSNAVPFYILPPLPVLLDVTPRLLDARYEIDSPGQILRITGFNFRQGARLLFDNTSALNGIEVATTFESSTSLTAYLPPQALRFGGVFTLRVRNVSILPESSGEAVTFQINNLRPLISTIDPRAVDVIGPGPTPVSVNMTITGSNFFPKSVPSITLKIPDAVPAIIPIGGAQRCIAVNGQDILQVQVIGPDGRGAPGVDVTFTAPGVNTNLPSGALLLGPNPAVMTVKTDQFGVAPPLGAPDFRANSVAGSYTIGVSAVVNGIPVGGSFNMTNLKASDACVTGGGTTIVYVNSNQLVITGYPFDARGQYAVTVSNAGPGGGVSNEVAFDVRSGRETNIPVIRSSEPLSPASIRAGSPTFELTVFTDVGSSVLEAGAWVNFGTVRLNRSGGDGGKITVQVPGLLVSSPGLVPISVTNPQSETKTGGTSTRVPFIVSP